MRLAPPLLRSPPFAGVAPSVAAVSTSAVDPTDLDVTGPLVGAITERRVGGTFWAPPARDPRPILLRPRADRDVTTMLARAREVGGGPADMLALLPVAAPESLHRRLRDAGVAIELDEVDPWSVIEQSSTLFAAADDEWRLLARLAGARTGDVATGRELAQALAAATYRDCFADAPASIDRTIEILGEWRRTLDRTRLIAVAMGMAWWKRDAIRHQLWSGRRHELRFLDDAGLALDQARASGGAIAAWPSRVPPQLEAAAEQAGVPVMRVEDGFVRSAGLGSNLHPPLSVVLDTRGIYYDPGRPSDLEHILEHAAFPPALIARGDTLARTLVTRGISKYAVGGAPPASVRRHEGRLVLVTGQVEDDLSVRRAGGDVQGNLDLLRRARAAEPQARILFKPHPDVDAGHRVGRVPETEALAFADEITRDPIDGLLAAVDAVHVLTSLTGFEALLRGREVTVHGQPFYAGWGLTRDLAKPLPRRTRTLSLGQLVAGALILYPLYLDPVTRLPCPPEVLLDRLARGELPRPSLLIRARALQGRIAKRLGLVTS